MNELVCEVYLRSEESDKPAVYHCTRVDDTNSAVLVIHQTTTSYGGKKIIRIPWDRIRHVETRA